ncbi:MAG: GIY-YIG nuclease family protein [Rhodothermales bacterium]
MTTRKGYVYILASKKNGTFYIGVTNDLLLRIAQHKAGLTPGFTKRYKVNRLVYYEEHDDIIEANDRERQLKKWYRKWKIALIEKHNPEWKDLTDEYL